MGDPMYTGDLFIDGIMVKSEPMSVDGMMHMGNSNTSASVPIPQRKAMDMVDVRDFGLEFNDPSPGGSSYQEANYAGSSLYSGASVWSPRSDINRMDDDDDIFQVDKADLIQGPTLAELNANDETLLGDLNFDDLLLPDDGGLITAIPPNAPKPSPAVSNQWLNLGPVGQNQFATSFPPDSATGFYRDLQELLVEPATNVLTSRAPTSGGTLKVGSVPFEPTLPEKTVASSVSPSSRDGSSPLLTVTPQGSLPRPPISPQPKLASTPPQRSPVSPQSGKPSTLHELLLKNSVEQQILNQQTIPSRSNSVGSSGRPRHISRLSSSAPTHLGLEQIWARREPRPHLLSTSSLAEANATSTSSISTGGVLSPDAHDYSFDEAYDSEDDTDHEELDSSDAESSDGEGGSKSRKERYFWQYNVQAKGPKGQRLVLRNKQEDPHCLDEVTDPVFSPECSLQGIKHSGKARKGDGNDLTPNPRKLTAIGKELDKLNRIINEMTPVSELPYDARPNSRKEKNKLASRACRLKKKAQHEANKIKLFGLECEHRRIITAISQIKQLTISKVSSVPAEHLEINKQVDKIYKSATKLKVAGLTTDFVNRTIDKQKSGVKNGGLDELAHHPT